MFFCLLGWQSPCCCCLPLDRFVVYAVSVTTAVVRVVYLDSSSMPPPDTFKRLAGQDFYLSLSDGLRDVRVSREQCDALRKSL